MSSVYLGNPGPVVASPREQTLQNGHRKCQISASYLPTVTILLSQEGPQSLPFRPQSLPLTPLSVHSGILLSDGIFVLASLEVTW